MKANDVLVTTTSSLDGWEIKKYISPVAAHIVAGTNFFSDVFASLSDIFGGRSHTYQKQLKAINDEAISQLQQQALVVGGNCVLAARIDHDEISGGGKSMFMVTASGTAVKAYAINNQTENSSNESNEQIEFEQLELMIKKQQLIEYAEKKIHVLSEKDWEIVVENRWSEFLPYLIKKIRGELKEKYLNYSNYYQQMMLKLLQVLPFDQAQIFLFDTVESEVDYFLKYTLIQYIGKLYLLDYGRVDNLLNSPEFAQNKLAIQLFKYDKLYYNIDDLKLMKALIDKIQSGFPKRGQEKSKSKLLSSKTKQVWACECGNEQPYEETYCKQCGNDIFGFGDSEYNPKDAIAKLKLQVKALNNYFNVG